MEIRTDSLRSACLGTQPIEYQEVQHASTNIADANSESDPNTGRSWLGAKRRLGPSQPRAGGALRSPNRSLGPVSGRRPLLYAGPGRSGVGCSLCVRPQERGVLPRGFQRSEMGRLQSGRIRGTGTDAPTDPACAAPVAAGTEVCPAKGQLTDSL